MQTGLLFCFVVLCVWYREKTECWPVEGLSYDWTSYRAFSLEKLKLRTGSFLIFCNKNHNEMSYFRSVYLSQIFFMGLEHLISDMFRDQENYIYQPYHHIRNGLQGQLSLAMRPERHCLLLSHFNYKSWVISTVKVGSWHIN